MQKLQRNFVESKMNKDLDSRFVPPGEYRDALNISVVTNTDSSSGAVQSSKGNNSISDLSKNIETAGVVSGAVTNKNQITFSEANEELQVGMYLYSEGIFPNLLTNPNFDTNDTGWDKIADSGSHNFLHVDDDEYHLGGGGVSGGYMYRGGGTHNSSIRQDVSVVSGVTYVLSYRRKYISGSSSQTNWYLDLDIGGAGSHANYGTYTSSTTDTWETVTTEITPTGTGTLNVKLYVISSWEGYLDNVVFKKKDTQPIITEISSDKKTITLNTDVTVSDGESVYMQYSKMLPNECVAAIDDESSGAIYWMTSSRDDDDSRKFNFRNAQQRSNVNLVYNPNFHIGTDPQIDGWTYNENDITVSANSGTGDNFVTIGHKAGSTAGYPGFNQLIPIKFEHGKTYKLTYTINAITGTCRTFLYGATDPETGVKGKNGYRPFYDHEPSTGSREQYFVFDKYANSVDQDGKEGSNYMSLRVELTQGTGGYAQTGSARSITFGGWSVTEHDADIAFYQDAIFKHEDGKTDIVANDIYMMEMGSEAPHFTKSADTSSTEPTIKHDAVTKDMLWEIVAKEDDSNGVPHVPFNLSTHAGYVKEVRSEQLVQDHSFTNSGWSNGDHTDTYWTYNSTGASGGTTGDIYHNNDATKFNAVPNGNYLATTHSSVAASEPAYPVPIYKGEKYDVKFTIKNGSAGAVRVVIYDYTGAYAVTPSVIEDGFYEFTVTAGTGGGSQNLRNAVIIQAVGTTTVEVDDVRVFHHSKKNVAILEPYSGTSVQFPTDKNAYKLKIYKPKVLDFNYNAKITGINIVDDMLFWTDGYSEPKKINVKNSKLGTRSIYHQSRVHNPLINSFASGGTPNWNNQRNNNINVPTKEAIHDRNLIGTTDSKNKTSSEHVTVVRKAPHQPPLIKLNRGLTEESGDKIDFVTFAKDFNASGTGGGASSVNKQMVIGDNIWINPTNVGADANGFEIGDIILITQGSSDLMSGSYDIKAKVYQFDASKNMKITILWINTDKEYSANTNYVGIKSQEDSVYDDRFVRFAYRYKYLDGEYSTFSPFSRPAFLPNMYIYDSKAGVNNGMVNQARSITIKGFIPQDIPADVTGVDLLYKESTNTNVYKVKSFQPNSAEWSIKAYGDNPDRDDSHLIHYGVYTFNTDNLQGALPSSQLLRAWDAVPKTAKAQEIIGNRLVYANYTQNYDINSNGSPISFTMNASLDNITDSATLDKPLTSCKSLRSYQAGIVYGDKYGRETPILTSSSAAIKSRYCPSVGRLLLSAQVTSAAPDDMVYYRHYVKESSSNFHNLVLDRWWDADDDTIWLSFYSHDRNKIQEGDQIMLKKKHGSSTVISEPEKIKVLAIEDNAPDSTKLKATKLAVYDADTVADIEGDGTAVAGSTGTFQHEHGFHATYLPAALPQFTHRGSLIEGDDVIEFTQTGWDNSGFAGFEAVSVAPGERLVIYLRRYGITSKKYEVQSITGPTPVGSGGDAKYTLQLDKPLGEDVNFANTGRYSQDSGVYNGLVMRGAVQIHMYLESYELQDYHEGRFFVKVEKTAGMQANVMCAGRDLVAREVMEMRLPYLAHNANYFSDGTTGISNTAWDETPSADCSGHSSKSFVSQRTWRSLEGLTASNPASSSSLNPGGGATGVAWATTGRYRALHLEYVDTNGAVQPLTYADTAIPAPSWQSASDPVCGGLSRPESVWTDYATRWSENASFPESFAFVDKEPPQAAMIWQHQYAVKDGSGIMTWDPLYSIDDGSGGQTTTIPYNHVATANDVVPGPANNWVDNHPARLYNPSTNSGGSRSGFLPWETNSSGGAYGQYQWGSNINRSRHTYRCIDGYDYNNSDFANGKLIGGSQYQYIPFGCDVGKSTMNISQVGNSWVQSGTRAYRFKQYIYNQVYGFGGWDEEDIGSAQRAWKPCKFYWREDPDKEIYTIKRAYYSRYMANFAWEDYDEPRYSSGAFVGQTPLNSRLKHWLFLDKPMGSGPSGWHPFYHALTNPSGAIDAGAGMTQPRYTVADGSATTGTGSGTAECPEYRTMVILDNVPVSDKAERVDSPAVFETVPFETQDVDIYYEAGGAIPISINGLDPTTFVPYIYIGSKVEIDYVSSGNNEVFTSEIGVIDHDGRIGLKDSIPADVAVNDVIRIYKTDNADSSYISFTNRVDGLNNSIYLNDTVHGGWCGIPYVSCINFQNGVESVACEDLFNSPKLSKGVIASTTLDKTIQEETYANGLIYSGIYNSKTGLNDFNQFIVADNITKDLNPEYGTIQKLNTRDADMTVLCEDKIVRLLVNKNSLYNADGTTNVTTSDLVLGQDVPYVGEYGIAKNPESFVNYGYKSFFTDRNRGAVLRLSQDGLTTISKNGMESWFDVNLRGKGFVIGTYDAKKYEYNLTVTLPETTSRVNTNVEYSRDITLQEANNKIIVGMYVEGDNVQNGSTVTAINNNIITINKDTLTGGAKGVLTFFEKKTVSFNDVSNGWSSFRSFIPEEGVSVRGEYFTYKDGTLYQHYTNDKANYFYNKAYNSSITAIFNDGPESVKDFRSLEYLGTIPKNKPTHYGWFISETTTDNETGYVGSFESKEGKYFGYIKGFDTGYTDPKQTTTQGLGKITKIETV